MFELKAESHTNVTVLRFLGNLLITDVVMPGMNGPDMARQMLERRWLSLER